MAIDINLLPPELQKKKSILTEGLPREVLVGSIGGILVLLLLVHAGLFFFNFRFFKQHKRLSQEWAQLTPAKANVDQVVAELRVLQKEHGKIEAIMKDKGISWARKLNAVSDNLSKGVWLRKMVFDGEILVLEGSALSRENREMKNVHQFTANLKNDAVFMERLADIELRGIYIGNITKVNSADFIIEAEFE